MFMKVDEWFVIYETIELTQIKRHRGEELRGGQKGR
jgi:hypothetical protein